MSKEALEFPCHYPIKAMGLNDKAFIQAVIGIVSKHVGEVKDELVETKLSKEEKYISLTINVYAKDRLFLEHIYADLRGYKGVLIVL